MARCPNFNRKQADRFVLALRTAATTDEAAAFADVSVSTIRTWRVRRPEFDAEVRNAQANVNISAVQELKSAAKGNWRVQERIALRVAQDRELHRLRELTTDAV